MEFSWKHSYIYTHVFSPQHAVCISKANECICKDTKLMKKENIFRNKVEIIETANYCIT